MPHISIIEGLVSMLVEQDGVDASNAVAKLRLAQKRIENAYKEWHIDLNEPMEIDDVDQILISATRNGNVDIFTA